VKLDLRQSEGRGEPSHAYEIRSLKKDRDRHFDTINRQYDEIRHLRSQVEAKDNLSDVLEVSRVDEKIAHNQVEDLKRQVREKNARIYEQREMYEGKLKGVNMENVRLTRKVGKFKGKAMRAEQELEDVRQQLENLQAS
jgi:chromosome segregation ATPase